MSDIETAGGGSDPITRVVDGSTITFAELSFYDRRDLLRACREDEKKAMTSFLNETNADDETRRQELAQFVNNPVGEGAWTRFFNSDDGKLTIVEKSLSKAGNANPRSVVEKLMGGIVDMCQLCAAITHTSLEPVVPLSLVAKLKGESEGSGTPNPTETGKKVPVGFGKL